MLPDDPQPTAPAGPGGHGPAPGQQRRPYGPQGANGTGGASYGLPLGPQQPQGVEALGTSTSQRTDKDAVDDDAAWLKAFRDSMNAPLDFNDPYVKNILMNARNTTMQSANNAGIFGPYSQNQAEASWVKGAAGLQQQNRAMALQAAGMGAGIDQNTRSFNYDVAKDKYTSDMDRWKYDQDKSAGFGGMIGGGLGAIGGGIGGFALGGPAGAAAGASAGWNVGSSIGKSIGGSGGPPPPTFRPGGY